MPEQFITNAHNFQVPANPWVQDPATGVMLTPDRPTTVKGLLTTPWRGLFIKLDHTPRDQYSASQLETANCQYLWGLRYLIGIRQPEEDIDNPEAEARGLARLPNVTKRERSLLFGKLLHKRLERYFRGEAVDWTDDVGQRALCGLTFLPDISRTRVGLRIEAPISLIPNSVFGGLHVAFVGFVDLEDPEILYDYKTTGNFRWMKRPDELRENVAACLYALSSMQRKGTQQQRCRWVYFASVGKPEARAVDFVITLEEALTVVRAAFVQAVGLRQHLQQYRQDAKASCVSLDASHVQHHLTLIDHLPRNTMQCKAFGGCPMHYEAGGPCNPGTSTFNEFDTITETTTQTIDMSDISDRSLSAKGVIMATLAERLAAQGQQQLQQAPATPQQVAQFTGFAQAPAAPQPGPAAFGGPGGQQPNLTEAPPVVQPFNPGGNPFAVPGQQPAFQAPPAAAVNPFAQQPAPAPVATPFAASSAPQVNPFGAQQSPAFPGFGQPPVQQVQQPVQAAPQHFPGVNAPEAVTAISAEAAAAQPAGGKRKRRTKAEMQAARQSPADLPTSVLAQHVADGGDYEVTITIKDNTTGSAITFGAPDAIADQMIGAIGPVLAGLR